MRCAICGRPLSNPQSLRRGIGPKCYAKYFKSGEFKKDRIEELRRKAAKEYHKNVKKYPLQEGEVRCKNCGKPVVYKESDPCPDAFCCTPCCPYATISPCPWEKERGRGSLVNSLAKPGKVLVQKTLGGE
ncbi:hypothetical protein DRP07_02165 [Archaeoglobales archaeon]|nr:MAG: hypothetical protein DRP07_02165 [Archaeoglobales archaeon]